MGEAHTASFFFASFFLFILGFFKKLFSFYLPVSLCRYSFELPEKNGSGPCWGAIRQGYFRLSEHLSSLVIAVSFS